MVCCRPTIPPRISAFSFWFRNRVSKATVLASLARASVISAMQRLTSCSASFSLRIFSCKDFISLAGADSTIPPPIPSFSICANCSLHIASAACSRSVVCSVSAALSTTTVEEFRTTDIRSPNRSEHTVSSAWSASPATLMTTEVQDLPPKESRRSIVSVESLYGTCSPRLPPKALITRPNALKEPLMLRASAMAEPSAPVRLVRSEPARSTKRRVTRDQGPANLRKARWTLTKQWLREDRSFKR
mmetsp:Transcript_111688/g.315451  ORF Transcript_111688/g.315451 Transcript_111688/m.315451 type:complete len:245 (+) Transcript_111688:241-975(+)